MHCNQLEILGRMQNATKTQNSARRQNFISRQSCNETSVGTTKDPIQSEKRKTRDKYIVTAGKSA